MTRARVFESWRPRLPAGAETYVAELLGRHPIEVWLSRPRRTKLGDHRPPGRGRPAHRITVNEDLNPYAFLTTLLHEIAHATTWERHRAGRRRVRPHGPEWKREFSSVLAPMVGTGILPPDVEEAIGRSLGNPAAATCSDRGLMLALGRYDHADHGRVFVEQLAAGTVFRVENGMVFRAGAWLRTRRQCFECRTGREYRVHGLARVEPLPASAAGVVSGARSRGGSRSGRS